MTLYIVLDFVTCCVVLRPKRFIGLLTLSADIGLSQIYWFWCSCSVICTDNKTVYEAEKMLELF